MTQRDVPSACTEGNARRLCSPAALRNVAPLTALLAQYGPEHGKALELASGTGQHIAHFAQALPGLFWQPSDVDPERLESIAAWTNGLANVGQAISLDATAPDWSAAHDDNALILVVNLLHLIKAQDVQTLIREAARALLPRGRLIIYGPFLRGGQTTSDGDARFHAALTQSGQGGGYKDDFDVVEWLHGEGLTLIALVEMPANNLAFVAEKAA